MLIRKRFQILLQKSNADMLKFGWIFSIALSSISFSQNFDYKKFTQKLCSPEFHGRGYVDGGDSLAADFIGKTFQDIGLMPYPGFPGFFQVFEFPVNTFPAEMNVELNGKPLKPGIHFVVDPASSGFQGELNLKNCSISELYDHKIEPRSWPANTALVVNMKTYGGDTLKKVNQTISEISTKIPIVEITHSKFTWSVSTTKNQKPFIQIQDSVFRDSPQKIMLDIDAKLKRKHHTKNVIGFLPAKKKTNKTIVFSAHYDHLGRMGKETYFPGANDNASGCAMLVYLADYFKKHPSKYNIVFMAFAGEEAGLIGSNYYVENPIFPLSDIRFLVNLDIMGSGEEGITAVNATLFPKEFKLLQKVNGSKKYLTTIKSRGPAANSDHYFFTEKGVPAFFIYTMGSNKNYHDIFDLYENLTFSAFPKIGDLIIDFTKKLN